MNKNKTFARPSRAVFYFCVILSNQIIVFWRLVAIAVALA